MREKHKTSLIFILLIAMTGWIRAATEEKEASQKMVVKKVQDFPVDGQGSAKVWAQADWIILTKRNEIGHPYLTRCKMLYSATGLYFLFECEDRKLTSSMTEDFAELYREDVIEVFLWPDERSPIYFEYEISPRNHELVLLVPNLDGKFLGWRPWRYEGERKTRKATSTRPGADGKGIHCWAAEFFIPFALLTPLQNVPPKPGSHWRVNLYRADWDTGERAIWSWKPYKDRFHDYHMFGSLYFDERNTAAPETTNAVDSP